LINKPIEPEGSEEEKISTNRGPRYTVTQPRSRITEKAVETSALEDPSYYGVSEYGKDEPSYSYRGSDLNV
jgi:hypothetical protein